MEIAVIVILAAIFTVEIYGVRSLWQINRKLGDRTVVENYSQHDLSDVMIPSGVLPIKRKTEQDLWESEKIVKSGRIFN